jgi:hypothetical protein
MPYEVPFYLLPKTRCVSGIVRCGWLNKTFECVWCERKVCYCQGANDDTPALCNGCVMRLN